MVKLGCKDIFLLFSETVGGISSPKIPTPDFFGSPNIPLPSTNLYKLGSSESSVLHYTNTLFKVNFIYEGHKVHKVNIRSCQGLVLLHTYAVFIFVGILDTRPHILKLVPSGKTDAQQRGSRGEILADRPTHNESGEIAIVEPKAVREASFTTNENQSFSAKSIDYKIEEKYHLLNSSSDQSQCSLKVFKEKWENFMPNKLHKVIVANFYSPDEFYVRKESKATRYLLNFTRSK